MYKTKGLFRSPSYKQALIVLGCALAVSFLATVIIKANSEDNSRHKPDRLIVVASEYDLSHESFTRFNRSLQVYGLDLIVLRTKSFSNERKKETKIDLFRKLVAAYKNDQSLLILKLDSNSAILNGDKDEIVTRFLDKFNPNTRVLFSSDSICWPNSSLATSFPEPVTGGERFLNSKAFIGYATSLWELLSAPSLAETDVSFRKNDDEDDEAQLYFTRAFLNADIRRKIGIEIDHRAELFKNLHGSKSNVELKLENESVRVKDLDYLTEPVVLQGNRDSKVLLNSLGNYLAKAWTVKDGCRHCNETTISLATTKDADLPTVLVGLFIEEPTPFLDDFFNSVRQLNYPTSRMHLLLHNAVEYHAGQVEQFLLQYGAQYASQQQLKSASFETSSREKKLTEWQARNYALEKCKQIGCDYYLSLDSLARLELADTLRILIQTNVTLVAPLLTRPQKLWSNFWGSLTSDGYYARSHDYIDLIRQDRVGLWNVAHIMNAYLINGNFIRENLNKANYGKEDTVSAANKITLSYFEPTKPDLKPVLAFTRHLRRSDTFQHLLNTQEFGHLVDPSDYNTSLLYPDFYQLTNNMVDWERNYLHENYSKLLENENTKLEQPCQDVFWFPLVSEKFCKQMIEMMESFGQWSGGTNEDSRIEGGYESVPTRDIHMKQVGLHEMWLEFLREYIMPIQLKEYIGYEHDPPAAGIAFVVRYHPEEQSSLRPHHDSSTYTLNIALNRPHIDYEGGGCRFVRYNCNVTESRLGWALIHPGRLTHYHEGLPVTNGTRYIMVTFVDP